MGLFYTSGQPMADSSRNTKFLQEDLFWVGVAISFLVTGAIHISTHLILDAKSTIPTRPVITEITYAQILADENSKEFDGIVDQIYQKGIKEITDRLGMRAPEASVWISPSLDAGMNQIRSAVIAKLRSQGFEADEAFADGRTITIDLSDLYQD